MGFLDKLFRFDQRALKKIEKQSLKVLAYEEEMASKTDDELRAKTAEFKERLNAGVTLEDIKFEAFAVAREAAKRVLNQFPFKVQVMGAIVLNQGDVAEMRTGEGKTLTATMAVYLNALTGKGVHVVTVNEYLAQRDAEWMGQIYRFLGLTVGVNLREKTVTEKQEAYRCDITYTTNSELGFDYLRDNMAVDANARVLRGLTYAVIDEADSILIDESRTPLIISGGSKVSSNTYIIADRFVKTLKREKDFTYDEKTKTCGLTEQGVDKAERMFGIKNLYSPEYNDLVHRIVQALKANYVMTRDVEYMVDSEGEIQLIDQFTGRILKGREYSDGLQQAIQAKENVKIKEETVTLATITYQNFFRLYEKLSGMTGTAKTEEEEFRKIYNMRVICIPTNRPIQRIDDLDLIFGNQNAKFKALVKEVQARHEKGQPILIGTVSVEMSEFVDRLLNEAHLPHNVLNAKNHAKEAEIIAHAGEAGAITIATNMAGRGTDIKLDEEARKAGGLCVFGTERHESRRIDNQLRGRSGRQGDPGYTRFFISLDDELMRRFGSDRLRSLYSSLDDEALESKMVQSAITNAQKRIEGQNFDTRKSLLDYDDVLRKQREIMYKKRDNILFASDIHEMIEEFFKQAGVALAKKSLNPNDPSLGVSGELLKAQLEPRFLEAGTIKPAAYDESPADEVGEDVAILMWKRYLERRKEWGDEVAENMERNFALRCIDRNWTSHIDTMDKLREGIHLRSYANTNPLQDYVNEGYKLFGEMMDIIAIEVVLNLLNVQVQMKKPDEEEEHPEEKGE
ncbi:protein translocase subunit SecA 1 [Coprobacillus sp. CAG:826]|nr:preprotein translocase subunit SecA [Coprobacillus sp.]CDD92228.1 protein translocase subunit SecA 1 [Coprobacillus sp. CAG:826]